MIKKTKSNLKMLFAFLLIFCMFLTACEIKNINDIDETTFSESETNSEPLAYPVIIGGVSIDKSPQNVVCLSPALTEILYEMGYGKSITGRGSYCDYPPSAKDAPDMGSSADPDLKAIIAIKPDIVLTASPIATKDVLLLEQSGIKVLLIPSPCNLTEFLNVYQAIGLMYEGLFTGKEKGESAFSEISKACDNKNVINIGKFLYITENFSAATGDTLESAVLSCFGTNIAVDYNGYDFDLELLSEGENEPDFIIANNKYSLDDLKNHEVLYSFNAIEKERVIFIDNSYFERPSAGIVKMIQTFIEDYKKLV